MSELDINRPSASGQTSHFPSLASLGECLPCKQHERTDYNSQPSSIISLLVSYSIMISVYYIIIITRLVSFSINIPCMATVCMTAAQTSSPRGTQWKLPGKPQKVLCPDVLEGMQHQRQKQWFCAAGSNAAPLRVQKQGIARRRAIEAADEKYFNSYGRFGIHREMLSDKVCLQPIRAQPQPWQKSKRSCSMITEDC